MEDQNILIDQSLLPMEKVDTLRIQGGPDLQIETNIQEDTKNQKGEILTNPNQKVRQEINIKEIRNSKEKILEEGKFQNYIYSKLIKSPWEIEEDLQDISREE